MARYLSPSGLAGGHVFGHVPDYISGQIHPHRKLEMLGIARKCVWDHKILHRKKYFFMTYLHVQFNIFFKYKPGSSRQTYSLSFSGSQICKIYVVVDEKGS